MKTKFILRMMTLICILSAGTFLYCEDSFNPAGSTVKTGDMKYEAHSHKKTASVKKIFSAPVSAGYFLIRCYQIVISPQDGPSCRFSPTCSVYGKEAVIKHGIIKGSFLAGERLIRCNPYNKGGKDPVPEKIFE